MSTHDARELLNPTDLNQSYVRAIMISSFFVWVILNESFGSVSNALSEPIFRLVSISMLYAFASVYYARVILPGYDSFNPRVKFIRYLEIIGDIVACTGAVYFAETYGLLLYPIFITIVIGYGFRFGFGYLIVAELIGLISLIWLVYTDPFLSEEVHLAASFLFGMLIIPTYAAFLLAKYQKILYQLEETNQARARFIANMSHELRTPLHAIIINTDYLLEREYETKSQNGITSPLRIIAESSNHLKRLVDRVLDIASSEADSFTLGEPKPLDLFRLLVGAVDIGAAEAKSKPVRVSLTIEPSTPRFILGWSQQLMEVLINTLGNAAKYTDKGFISIRVHTQSPVPSEDHCRLLIKISDSGCGMSETQLSSAFDPFVLGDDSRSRHFGGTGIGLTITKQYVEAMLGSIELSSQPGDGSTVYIDIPYTETETRYQTDRSVDAAIVLIANVGAPHNEYKPQELAGLGIHLIPKNEFSKAIHEIERLDCILIDDGLLNDVVLVELETALLNFNVPIVLVGDCKVGSEKIQRLLTYQVSKLNPETLSDIDALCSNRNTPQLPVLNIYTDASAKKILMIDDNEINLASANLVLSNARHIVDAVTSGDDAISKLRVHSYDLIFIDMHMPGKNGIETLKTAREVVGYELPPVIFLTADVTKQAEIDAVNAGAAGILTKPMNSATLRAAVQEYANLSAAGGRASVGGVLPVSDGSQAYAEVDDMLSTGITKEAVGSLIQKFSEDFNRDLLQGGIAAAQSDEECVRKLLHRMQGSAAAMHFQALLDQLKVLERRSTGDMCSSFLGSVNDVQELVNEAVKDLRDYLFHQN